MSDETLAAIVALVRADPRPGPRVADELETGLAPLTLLEQTLSGISTAGQQSLLNAPADAGHAVARAVADLAAWRAEGIAAVSVLDPDYPDNLRAVHDRPPLLFCAGRLPPVSDRPVAVIGSRQASAAGLARARAVAVHLIERNFTVASGLAAGIDRAAHIAALEHNGHTIAVIGTGLRHSYPPENADLQRAIAARDAVISPFWPDAGASRDTFPRRNAVMSGLSLATVIVEAGMTSGARIQARLSLAHGRPVFLFGGLLAQPWAQSLAARPAVHVFHDPSEITDAVESRMQAGALIA